MIDMKYKVYCISAMMLCCVVSKAQEKILSRLEIV